MKRAVHLFVAVFIFAVPVHAWPMTPQEFDAKAIPLMSDPQKADTLLKLCDQALNSGAKKNPEFEAFVHVMKSIAWLSKKDHDKAEAEARLVIDSGQQGTLGYTAMMDSLFARKKYDDGLAICLDGAKMAGSERNQEAARQDCHLMYLQATSVTPSSLWNAYSKNATEADKLYKEHPITLLGTASNVEENNGTIAKIFFAADKSGSKKIECVFENSNPVSTGRKAQAPGQGKPVPGGLEYNLSETSSGQTATSATTGRGTAGKSAKGTLPVAGETVIISGNVKGVEGNTLVLTGCSLVRQ